MKITGMSETSLRSTSRTPSILQNGELSPTPSKHSAGSALSPVSNKSVSSIKLQTLKQRKLELDKLLLEKNNLLQQLCREEAQLIGCYPSIDAASIESGDGVSNTLRRRVDTSFKLSENLLNNGTFGGKEDDIHKLLLGKQIQQQISEASMKMANDLSQTKSIRRTHKQNYEAAQQKLQSINKSLSMLKKRPNTDLPATSSDDMSINLSYNKYNNNINNNNNNNNNNSVNYYTSGNISNNKYTNNNINQNHNNNNNNTHLVTERRNSIISTSSSQHLATKSRPRCDSYSGIGVSSEYGNGSTGKVSPSPSTLSYYHMHHLHYNNHNHLADKVVYLTNAVSNAAAAANSSALASPKYGRLKKPLSVDTSSAELHHYVGYMPQPQTKAAQYQHGQQFSPREFATGSSLGNMVVLDDDDDDDDLAGQYATLMTLNNQPMDYIYQPMQPAPMTPSYEAGSHYSIIGERSSLREARTSGEQEGEQIQSQGLGGYWITLDNNEKIWCSLDNRYSSLDRKSQKNKIKKQMARHTNQPPTKSTSLGSFNFITRPDEASDAISVTSGNSEHKKMREKQWCETSLDGPIIKQKHPSPVAQPASPLYWRDRTKLSSQSMHSPGKTGAVNQSISVSIQKQPLPSPTPSTNLNKSLSNSATVLSTTDSVADADYYLYQQQMSPPYYHPHASGKSPAVLPNATIALHDTPLRRTASSVSSNRTEMVLMANEPVAGTPVTPSDTSNYQNISVASANSSDIHIESPKNMTVVQPAKFQPYKEVSKPFEMSDFYKYSTKFRQKNSPGSPATAVMDQGSPQLPPKNANMMQHRATANNTPSVPSPYTIRYH